MGATSFAQKKKTNAKSLGQVLSIAALILKELQWLTRVEDVTT